MEHYSEKRERNVKKDGDESRKDGRQYNRKGEVESSVQEESSLKKYPLWSRIPQYTHKKQEIEVSC